MQYDFDQVVDRSKNLSAKYDERVKKFGTDDVIPLWIADMDFRTAQPVIDALKARAEEGIWGYTARPASYFEAVKNWQKRRNGWNTDTALMSFSPGVVQTLSVMIRLYTPQNGNVLIQTPVYGEFYDMTELAGRHVIENQLVEQDGAWTVDWADFEEKLRSADIFLLCNPHNPLGIVWTEEELRRLGITRLRAADKGRDSVQSGIARLQEYDMIVHPRCRHTLEELAGYRFEETAEGVRNRPEDRNNHLMDALRYAMEDCVWYPGRHVTVKKGIPGIFPEDVRGGWS